MTYYFHLPKNEKTIYLYGLALVLPLRSIKKRKLKLIISNPINQKMSSFLNFNSKK